MHVGNRHRTAPRTAVRRLGAVALIGSGLLVQPAGVPLAGAQTGGPTLTVKSAHRAVVAAEAKLANATAEREAARRALRELSSAQAHLVDRLSSARSDMRRRAVEAFVSSSPDGTAMVLLGGANPKDASDAVNLMAHAAKTSRRSAVRYEQLRRKSDPALVRRATDLQRLDQAVNDANDAVLAARANEAEAERQQTLRVARATTTTAAPPSTATPSTATPSTPAAAVPTAIATVAPSTVPAGTAPPTTPPATTPAPTSTTTAAPSGRPGPSEEKWAKLRACESTGNYQAVSPSGKYRGAYQFDRTTWATLGTPGDPAAASPAEQDARAKALYASRGWRPWPVCGRHLI